MPVSFTLCLLGAACAFNVVNCGTIPAKKQAKLVDYLMKYGYLGALDPYMGSTRTDKELREAVKLFQRVAGIPETGDLTDSRTLHMVHKPRCGMRDIRPSGTLARRRKRYVIQGTKWNKKDLTFKIINYTPDLTRKETRDTIMAAFSVWSKVVPLTFTETDNNSADIKIRFISGYHGDGYPFDGKGGTLAHAFYPHNNEGLAGDAHFDEAETFTLRTNAGVNLFWVAVHEFGHSLGLEHTFHRDALMYPFYKGYVPDFKLHEDDIKGIQEIYGKPEVNPHTLQPETLPPPTEKPIVPKACNTAVDIMVHASDGYTYAFKGEHFWPISDQGQWTGALKIKNFWRVLPGNLDAAVTRADKTTLFFKGSRYWVFRGRTYLKGPLEITDKDLNLPKELTHMDAALVWAANGQTYFFKGDKYWRYNDELKRIDDGYPKLIKDAWRGLPDRLDAAMQWKNGKSYFFKGLEYYELNDMYFTVSANYPKKISSHWMGCYTKGNIKP